MGYELMNEARGTRTYMDGETGETVIVKAEIASRQVVLAHIEYELGDVREQRMRQAEAQLRAWFADDGDALGHEPVGAPQWSAWTVEQVYVHLSDESGNALRDENGDLLMKRDENGNPIVLGKVHVARVSQAYWPLAAIEQMDRD